jgi:tetratricopeptide (TPR) repeat protein
MEQKMPVLGGTSDKTQACRRMLQQDPRNRVYHVCLIRAYQSNGETVELLQEYEAMLATFGNVQNIQTRAAEEYYKWGQSRAGTGDFEGAIRAYQRAYDLVPESDEYAGAAQAQIVTLNVPISVRDSAGNPVEGAIAMIRGEEVGRSDASGKIEAVVRYLSVGLLGVDVFSEESGSYHADIPITLYKISYSVSAQLSEELYQALSNATRSAQAGNNKIAESLYTILVKQASDSQSDINNSICWDGSLDRFAELVMPACERAVALAPQDGAVVDSRGLARALTGNFPGAVKDFKFFVQWAQETRYPYPDRIAMREDWIPALEAGQNPFDPALLNLLRTR